MGTGGDAGEHVLGLPTSSAPNEGHFVQGVCSHTHSHVLLNLLIVGVKGQTTSVLAWVYG